MKFYNIDKRFRAIVRICLLEIECVRRGVVHRMRERVQVIVETKNIYLVKKIRNIYIPRKRERVRETGEDKDDITKTKENKEGHMRERKKRDKIVMTISQLQRIRETER